MTLNEREAHCLARLLQCAWYSTAEKGLAGSLAACKYCKYQCFKDDEQHKLTGLEGIRKRLTEETGVDVTPAGGAFLMDSDFPYLRFLKNAHEDAKKHYREMLKEFRDI